MLVCTLDGDLYPPLEEPTGTDPKSKKKDKDKDKKFIWNHGSKWAVFPHVKLQQFKSYILPSKANLASLTPLIKLLCSPVTCPLKNTRKRRFRKTAKKKVLAFSLPYQHTSPLSHQSVLHPV